MSRLEINIEYTLQKNNIQSSTHFHSNKLTVKIIKIDAGRLTFVGQCNKLYCPQPHNKINIDVRLTNNDELNECRSDVHVVFVWQWQCVRLCHA